jgi:hypothetical protein
MNQLANGMLKKYAAKAVVLPSCCRFGMFIMPLFARTGSDPSWLGMIDERYSVIVGPFSDRYLSNTQYVIP